VVKHWGKGLREGEGRAERRKGEEVGGENEHARAPRSSSVLWTESQARVLTEGLAFVRECGLVVERSERGRAFLLAERRRRGRDAAAADERARAAAAASFSSPRRSVLRPSTPQQTNVLEAEADEHQSR
jgi:hypothetical protein